SNTAAAGLSGSGVLFSLTPSSVGFGTVATGATATQTVTVTNESDTSTTQAITMQVAGPGADTERDFAFRALWVARGSTEEQPGFDENVWASLAGHDERALADLVEEFAAVREATLALARTITPEMAVRQSVINGHRTSVRAMFHMVAGHERHHLAILRERYLGSANG
ncbi:MAG: DinB family protein, partial [Gemmatimonadota bacterium]